MSDIVLMKSRGMNPVTITCNHGCLFWNSMLMCCLIRYPTGNFKKPELLCTHKLYGT